MTDRTSIQPPEVSALAAAGTARLRRRLADGSPGLAVHADAWMRTLSGGLRPEEYFLHPQAFPMLALPWWLESSIRGTPDRAFQTELAYSSVSGYYFVRLIDDRMDGERAPRPELLPALIVLHAEFQHTYAQVFPPGHSFWSDFFRFSYEAAEAASTDAGMTDIDREDFLRVSSHKVAGAKLPLAAVCHRHGRADLLEPWAHLVDLLGRWHQMVNDIQDWSRDTDRGAVTYFLCEGRRRVGASGSISGWVIAEGLHWGMEQVNGWMEELLHAAAELGAPDVLTYLAERRRRQSLDWAATEAHLERLAGLARALE